MPKMSTICKKVIAEGINEYDRLYEVERKFNLIAKKLIDASKGETAKSIYTDLTTYIRQVRPDLVFGLENRLYMEGIDNEGNVVNNIKDMARLDIITLRI